jgi:hypothetical protein
MFYGKGGYLFQAMFLPNPHWGVWCAPKGQENELMNCIYVVRIVTGSRFRETGGCRKSSVQEDARPLLASKSFPFRLILVKLEGSIPWLDLNLVKPRSAFEESGEEVLFMKCWPSETVLETLRALEFLHLRQCRKRKMLMCSRSFLSDNNPTLQKECSTDDGRRK